MDINPRVLEGPHVRLEPLSLSHADAFYEAGRERSLTRAAERLDCTRVEFMADALNEVSRTAILRLGAKQEGTLRNYIVREDGQIHDGVIYSMVESEWPSIRARLQGMLVRQYNTDA